ncbi:hypothetical protein BU23DRAFT_58818 [Bimuria novae-zelandiae CBS 107.79]|uniref:Only prolin and serin are matching in the corresponding protein n=1 Tax=Bimuria novae-zelandiae CBS 107.79 TaxID=1447943 RepID=A0A6A5VLW6_9PLEO|nr:hypothetical protein BU23DRAFT_58818 [Bimuria novae-zelandiae CBS 107.79]
MPEMKPFMLPKLVAQRKSSKSSLDMSHDPASSVHSSTDSGFYSASECSTPPTPSFYRGHLRFPSSTSSLSSSPPAYDPVDATPNASGKLPQLTEDVEREEDYVTVARCQCDAESSEDPAIAEAYDFIGYGYESPNSKRRCSAESSAQSVTHKFERNFPSFSRKLRERKRASTLNGKSRSATPSRVPSTRSSSITSSIHQAQGYEPMELFPPKSISASVSREHIPESIVSSPIDIAKANAVDMDVDEIDSERFATTPLLPPLLVKTRFEAAPPESPLHSPEIVSVDPMHSLVSTPVETPATRAYPTPPLSTKASVASFKTSRMSPLVPSNEIPSLALADPDDKWALVLGHNNFTIHPEPYVPEVCDAAALRQLFADWELARCNFTKHQVRMAEHNGPTSKAYLLCEKKWSEIDAQWKKNHDLANSRAIEKGAEPEPTSPMEPAPLSKMPTLNDPKSEGKFPKLGDEDIVGPMVQIAASPLLQRTPPRKRAFFKFLSDLKFPAAFLGRSSTGARGP